ncbi:helix-turn-helix transcriptional regulator [Komagataeibacter xylinus]|uniref:helix-turn-helix domain-containing protein n=1 Tax=Komagataeibacter xylinus TaxID=28448 RepID=UPI00132FF753|nr:helix-turn-helix transcriptional regulator [Komagataeibacter xylinus]
MTKFLSADDVEAAAKRRGLTIPMLCSEAGVSHPTFYRWKAGAHTPTLKTYQKIIAALRARRRRGAPIVRGQEASQ